MNLREYVEHYYREHHRIKGSFIVGLKSGVQLLDPTLLPLVVHVEDARERFIYELSTKHRPTIYDIGLKYIAYRIESNNAADETEQKSLYDLTNEIYAEIRDFPNLCPLVFWVKPWDTQCLEKA